MNNSENNVNKNISTNVGNTSNINGIVSSTVQNMGSEYSTTNAVSPVSNNTGNIVTSTNINTNTNTSANTNTEFLGTNQNVVDGSSINNDSNLTYDEKLKQIEINYTPPSKFKSSIMILLAIVLIGFVIFLPEITSMVNKYKTEKNKIPEKIITSGRLECSLKSHTANLDMEYLRIFKFNDSKLYEANYKLTTKGDVTLDEETLDEMASKCNILSKSTKDLAGVSISCSYSQGKLVEKQSYIFASIIYDKLDAAFTEAGGTYVEFEDGQEIGTVEKMMNAAGYTCSKKE